MILFLNIKIKFDILSILVFIAVVTCPVQGEAQQTDEDASKVLNIGFSETVFEEINPKDALAVSKMLSNIILKKHISDMSAHTKLYAQIEDIEDDLKSSQLDLIILTTYEYLVLKNDLKAPIEPLMVGEIMEESIYNYYLLIVRKESAINDLKDLRNQSILVQSTPKYSITNLWLEKLLKQTELPEAKLFFSSVKESSNASKSLMPVFFGNTKACIVREPGFNLLGDLNPQIKNELKVIERSPGLMHTIICLRSGLNEEKNHDLINKTLLRIHEDPEGREILKIFRVSRVVPYKDEYIEETVKLINH